MRQPQLFIVLAAFFSIGSQAAIVLEKSQPSPYAFSGRYPHWTWGFLVGTESNRSAAPAIVAAPLSGGPEIRALGIPGAVSIVVESASKTPAGGLVACGAAYNAWGTASGSLALLAPGDADFHIIPLAPYFPYALAVAADGSVWTSGDEMINSDPHAPGISPKLPTLRHFSAAGKLLEGLVPRDSLQSMFSASYGFLQAAQDRIGWYTGPRSGPGSVYFEVSQDGTLTKYPGIQLHEHESVTGIALAANGRTYATSIESSHDGKAGNPHIFSIGRGETTWKPETLSPGLAENPSVHLYGATGNQLALWPNFVGTTIITARAE